MSCCRVDGASCGCVVVVVAGVLLPCLSYLLNFAVMRFVVVSVPVACCVAASNAAASQTAAVEFWPGGLVGIAAAARAGYDGFSGGVVGAAAAAADGGGLVATVDVVLVIMPGGGDGGDDGGMDGDEGGDDDGDDDGVSSSDGGCNVVVDCCDCGCCSSCS